MSKPECEEFLRANDVGRVVYTDRALPAVMPVHYAYVDGRVILRVVPDSRPAEKLPGSVVAFHVDDLSAGGSSCLSILVTGPCHRLKGEEGPRRPDKLAFSPWPYPSAPLVLEIVALLMTGTRIPVRLAGN
jgi:nitroimidazol reductase NimA-like FMN-containing flavoprotein (pyridoxamine 5'-phosphate oxidase superfamily)